MLTGLDLDAKADFAEAALRDATGGPARFAAYDLRREHGGEADRLTLTVKDPDPDRVGRGFFGAVAGPALAGYPGLYLEHASPQGHRVRRVLARAGPRDRGGRGRRARGRHPAARYPARPRRAAPPPGPRADAVPPPPVPPLAGATERHGRAEPDALRHGRTVRLPLGTLVGARSGDKGGDANVGLWARDDAAYAWLRDYLDVPRLRALLPETARLPVSRYELPNLRARQLRRARPARRRRGRLHPGRPAGQGARRAAARLPRRHTRDAGGPAGGARRGMIGP